MRHFWKCALSSLDLQTKRGGVKHHDICPCRPGSCLLLTMESGSWCYTCQSLGKWHTEDSCLNFRMKCFWSPLCPALGKKWTIIQEEQDAPGPVFSPEDKVSFIICRAQCKMKMASLLQKQDKDAVKLTEIWCFFFLRFLVTVFSNFFLRGETKS